MTLGVFNRTVLLALAILLFLNIVYKAAVSPYDFFGVVDMDLKVFGSLLLMYFLGDFFLSKKIKEHMVSSDITVFLLMAIFVYSVYIVSDVKFYIEALYILKNSSNNFFSSSYFTPSSVIFAWVSLLIASSLLKNIVTSPKQEFKSISKNAMLSYVVLFFGLIYILDTNISNLFGSIKYVLMQESSVMNTIDVKWFVHLKRLLINAAILLVYWKLIHLIENKYTFELKKQLIFFTMGTVLLIGAYSFHSFVMHVNFLIFSEMSRSWQVLYLLFIPILLGFYLSSRYLSNQPIAKIDDRNV